MWNRYFWIFIISFVLNLLWENSHSFLYLRYQGGAITEPILLRATLFDAIFITFIFFLTQNIKSRGVRLYLLLSTSLFVAIGIELLALATNRWAYSPMMPVVPFLGVGLSPILQLPLLVYLAGLFTGRLLHEG